MASERRKVCRDCGQPPHTVDGRSPYAWRQGQPVETARTFIEGLLLVGFLMLAAFGSAYFVGLYGWPW